MNQIHQNRCKVKIKSIGKGILLHNPQGMLIQVKGPRTKIPSPEEEAAMSCYWTEDHSSLAFPGWNLFRGLVQACSGLKVPTNKKKPLSPVVCGDVSVEPDMIPFETTLYDIDLRRVVIKRNAIIRARPLLKNWTLAFDVCWESQFLGADFHSVILPDLLEILGKSIGIGDFRPAMKGPFGRFYVESIELVK